jgi:uncharacterized protein involved in type VI secretion and phage assembly
MEEPSRELDLDDYAQLVREAAVARATLVQHASDLREVVANRFEILRAKELEASRIAEIMARNANRRKPPEAGLAVPAVPPRGPPPLQGGAEAPLEFD